MDWKFYIFQYVVGGIIFFIGLFWSIKTKAADKKSKSDFVFIVALVVGFIGYLVIHGVWLVAGYKTLFYIDSKYSAELNKSKITKEIKEELAKHSLTDDLKIEVCKKDSEWVIEDINTRKSYLLKRCSKNISVCLYKDSLDKPIFKIELKLKDSLDKKEISKEIKDIFKENKIEFSNNTEIVLVKKDNLWLIKDNGNKKHYVITKEKNKLNVRVYSVIKKKSA